LVDEEEKGMTDHLLLIILGMSVVTLIPRWLPVWIMDRITWPDWAREWLDSIPYAALGALIFPGIMSVAKGEPWIGLAGGIVAAILAYWRLHIMYVVFGSILAVMVAKAI
jgi:branched-subunit amino acid transport protein